MISQIIKKFTVLNNKKNLHEKHNLFSLIIILYITSGLYFIIDFSSVTEFPINDEGGFAFPIWSLIYKEKLYIFGNNAAWSIPQTYLGYIVSKIFGFSFLNLRLLALTISSLFYFFIYFYLNKFNDNKNLNSLFLGIFIFFPSIYFNSYLFMSDFLFLFLLIVALYYFESYINKNSIKNLILLNIFIIICYSQRQFGFMINFLVFGYLIYTYIIKKKKDLNLFIGLIINCIVFLIIYFFIKNSLNLSSPFNINLFEFKQIFFISYNFFQITSYIGLFSIPFILIQRKENFDFNFPFLLKIFFYSFIIICIIANIILIYYFGKTMPYFDNQISKFGLFGENEIIKGNRSEIISFNISIILTVVSNLVFILFLSQTLKFKNYKFIYKDNLIYIFSFIYLIFTLFLFTRFNDRYLFILFLAVIFYFTKLTSTKKNFLNINSKKILSIFLFLSISLSFMLSNHWVKFSNLRWSLVENFIKKNNIPIFNFHGGHEWSFFKHKEYVNTYKPEDTVIKYNQIRSLDDYKFSISFSAGKEVVKKKVFKTIIKEETIFINKL